MVKKTKTQKQACFSFNVLATVFCSLWKERSCCKSQTWLYGWRQAPARCCLTKSNRDARLGCPRRVFGFKYEQNVCSRDVCNTQSAVWGKANEDEEKTRLNSFVCFIHLQYGAKVFNHPFVYIFCSQTARLSCNFFKTVLMDNALAFLKVCQMLV